LRKANRPSVNPACSNGVAVFVGDRPIAQLRLFWLAPLAGTVLGALAYRAVMGEYE
jgi:aquaporin Z